jgi:hypothetical protein
MICKARSLRNKKVGFMNSNTNFFLVKYHNHDDVAKYISPRYTEFILMSIKFRNMPLNCIVINLIFQIASVFRLKPLSSTSLHVMEFHKTTNLFPLNILEKFSTTCSVLHCTALYYTSALHYT